MNFDKFLQYVPHLSGLPSAFSTDQQDRLLPYRKKLFEQFPRLEYRPAAVLVLVYPSGNAHEATTVLIERPVYDGVHSGQIAFPGGRMEPSDKDLYETALREAAEEVNIQPEKVRFIRPLSPVKIPVSAYEVTPFLAYSTRRPELRPQPGEVENIVEVPFSYLLEHPWQTEYRTYDDYRYLIHYIPYGKYKIWGATAMVIAELRDIFRHLEVTL